MKRLLTKRTNQCNVKAVDVGGGINDRSEKINSRWSDLRMDFDEKPLQKFVTAKKCVTRIFNELNSFLANMEKFVHLCGGYIHDPKLLEMIQSEYNMESVEKDYFKNLMKNYKEQINSILEVSLRDTMKVAFFGRTSNGKSTVINSLLNDKILPSGIGHTTSCFVSMHGTNENEPYILVDKCNEKRPVSNLRQLASALNDNRLDPSSLIQLYWPTDKCPILSNEVVFVDSPGVDVSPDLDVWIEKYCRDADVFVLVTNSESTLNNSEKKFFYRVNKYVSRPNIFILNNRWDASALEPDDIDAVRSQHMERGVDFLVNELKCATKNDAQQRIFFTSARETLQSRIADNPTNHYTNRSVSSSLTSATPDSYIQNVFHLVGYEDRLQEFEKFEQIFHKSLSKSAINTKFKTRTDRALAIVGDISNHMKIIQNFIQSVNDQSLQLLEQLKVVREQQQIIRQQAVENIEKQITETENDIFTMICSNLVNESSQINKIVNSFHYPFYDNPMLLEQYKNQLVAHVESGLERVMVQRCNQDVSLMIETVQNSILSFVTNATHKANVSVTENNNSTPKTIGTPFKMNFNFPLYISAISQDFNGDIKFRFSLSPSAILSWVISLYNPNISDSLFPTSLPRRKIVSDDEVNYNTVSNSVTASPPSYSTLKSTSKPCNNAPRDEKSPTKSNGRVNSFKIVNASRGNSIDDNGVNPAILHAIGLMTSTTSGLLLISVGMAWKFIGPRFILAIGGIYSSVYVYEKVTWTDAAKEKSYKRQFSRYVSRRLKKSIQMVALEFCKVSSKELRLSLKQGRTLIDNSIQKSDNEISKLNKQIHEFKHLESQALALENHAAEYQQRLQHFQFEYSLA